MKTKFLFIFLIVVVFLYKDNTVIAQFRYGDELTNINFKILTSRGGHLYSGIDNYILISSEIFKNSDTIHIESTNGKIFADSGQVYLLIPERPGKVRLTIYSIIDRDTTLLGYKHFLIKQIPDPQLIIGNTLISISDTIMKKTLLDCDGLAIYISNDIIGSENWLKISEFSIGYNYGGFHVSHLNLTNTLSEKTKQLLMYMGPDHEISIKLTVESQGFIFSQIPIYKIIIY